MSILSDEIKAKWLFGSTVPFAEPAWARGCPSPYYNDSHRRLRAAMRTWVDENLMPHTIELETSPSLPDSLYEKAAKDGLIMPMASGATIPQEWRGKYPIIGNVSAEEWDGFHDLIIHDEFGRVGGIGIENGLVGGAVLAVPALQKYGSQQIKDVVIPDILSGRTRIALAITEPGAGSDVQGVQTEARVSEDGSHFIVDGEKKWITSGMYAHYFLTMVKEVTGEFTLLVIPRTEGLTTKHITLSGSTAAGTAFVDFENVKVPINMVVGKRGQGLKYVMSNFNHERLFIGIQALRCARVCLEDSISHAMNRETFGKKLVDHPVLRLKIANMSRETEALQAWSLIYQISKLSSEEAVFLLAGTTAQLKAHAGIVLEHVVREAIQIMGGIGLTRGGRGERVERIWRDVKAITVPGGSEEILLDLATRRALNVTAKLQAEEAKVGKNKL
ncbi:acyl-CoA dehydrogenase [Penicillium concentricum]|uniref:Acyl-CoA dehydrogenase n=1 Tax=Penicillium concentricum TaxID=293559 RepID=A0A9W9RUI7_9EURO|nr:acyl-CoA dehydrogenase [Penicillium concentricum]KAJ5365519.1 acyl-CoA dehydrogenase [Penicillium concentricum]